MEKRTWKVGELAKLAGLTIRTLHHYDEIGLLCPMFHSDAGHRLYTESNIVKLQQIMSLKELGFSLDKIKDMFEKPQYNPKEIIEIQLRQLTEEIKLKEALKQQLQELWEVFDTMQEPTLEQFIRSIELIRNQSKYFSEEQRIKMKKSFHKLNTQEAKNMADSWGNLIDLFQEEMKKGTPVNSPNVIELANRWQEGVNFFTGGDTSIIHSAERYYIDNPQAAKGSGMSGELYKYITEALTSIISNNKDSHS